MANYIDEAVATLRNFEGVVPWMYLDTVGKVTVGVGLMLANEIAAHSLPFFKGERPATDQEISEEFVRVGAMKRGQPAKLYRKPTSLMLKDEAIDDLLKQHLVGSEGYLRSHLPGYDTLPDPAKLALLDMVYNLGPGRFFSEYPHLLADIANSNWRSAALASARKGPSNERNAWTRQQFLDAAKAVVTTIQADARRVAWPALLLATVATIAGASVLAILLGQLEPSPTSNGSQEQR